MVFFTKLVFQATSLQSEAVNCWPSKKKKTAGRQGYKTSAVGKTSAGRCHCWCRVLKAHVSLRGALHANTVYVLQSVAQIMPPIAGAHTCSMHATSTVHPFTAVILVACHMQVVCMS
jgi:hypothetical protein